MQQFQPEMGQSNATMQLSGHQGLVLDVNALNQQHQQVIAEQEGEDDSQNGVRPFMNQRGNSPALPRGLVDQIYQNPNEQGSDDD